LVGCTNQDTSGICKIKCNTCNKAYVGQTGRAISVRYREHIRYITTNYPQLAYATHILQNRHEFGPKNETLQLIKTCAKGMRMNSWESMFIQKFHRKGMLIAEQQPYDHNPPTTAYRKQGHAQTTTKRNRNNQYRTQTSKGAQAKQPHVSNPSGICNSMIKICCINDGVEYSTPDTLMLHGILITDMLLQYHIY